MHLKLILYRLIERLIRKYLFANYYYSFGGIMYLHDTPKRVILIIAIKNPKQNVAHIIIIFNIHDFIYN